MKKISRTIFNPKCANESSWSTVHLGSDVPLCYNFLLFYVKINRDEVCYSGKPKNSHYLSPIRQEGRIWLCIVKIWGANFRVCQRSSFYLNNSLLGLFVPFAKSGKALVFASMVTLVFGHWMSIGSIVHFPHPPVQTFYSGNNLIMPYNCSIGSPPMIFPPNQQKTGDKR